MNLTDKIVALIVLVSLGLTIALNSKIVAEKGCDSSEEPIDQITWGLGVGVLIVWILSILAIVYRSGLGFGFETFKNVAGEYVLLSLIGSVVVPAIIISEGEENGSIDTNLNNLAVLGLVMSVWMALSTFLDVMFNRKLYNEITKTLGIKNKTK